MLSVWLAPSLALASGLPWNSADVPPAVAGIHLGDDRTALERALGVASDVQDLAPDSFAMYYKDRGLIVLYSTHEGVTTLYLLTAQAGDIDGVRVGDTRDAVLAKWGAPSAVQGSDARYQVGSWMIGLQLGPQQTIVRLSLGRSD